MKLVCAIITFLRSHLGFASHLNKLLGPEGRKDDGRAPVVVLSELCDHLTSVALSYYYFHSF